MSKIRRTSLVAATLLLVLFVATGDAHDMLLKLPTYFLQPGSAAEVMLINRTFDTSENAISRDRMVDVSIVHSVVHSDGEVVHPPEAAWADRKTNPQSEGELDASFLRFETRGSGTMVVGVSTGPTTFELSAEDFNEYLAHDLVLDVLEKRENDESSSRRGRTGTGSRRSGLPLPDAGI